jgi:hypothetical protein
MLTSAAGEFEVFANAPWFGDKLQGQNMEIRWSILVANNSTVISPKKWKINHHWTIGTAWLTLASLGNITKEFRLLRFQNIVAHIQKTYFNKSETHCVMT